MKPRKNFLARHNYVLKIRYEEEKCSALLRKELGFTNSVEKFMVPSPSSRRTLLSLKEDKRIRQIGLLLIGPNPIRIHKNYP
jgi:hypothetical protein